MKNNQAHLFNQTVRAGYDALQSGDFNEAEKLARQGLSDDPDNRDAQLLLAKAVGYRVSNAKGDVGIPKEDVSQNQVIIFGVFGTCLLILGIWLGFEPAIKGMQEGFLSTVQLHYPWSGEPYRRIPLNPLVKLAGPCLVLGVSALARGFRIQRILRSL